MKRHYTIVFSACMAFVLLISSLAISSSKATQTIRDFRLPHYKDGVLDWRVTGTIAYVLQNRDILITKPLLKITETKEKPGYDIKALQGTVTENKNIMIFEGNVTLDSTDGSSMSSERLRWEVDTKTATSETHVDIKKGKMHLSGTGLKAKSQPRDFRLASNVKMILPQDKVGYGGEGTVTITTKGRMTYVANKARFESRPTVTSKTGTMISDVLDIYIDSATETISRAVATGNVDSTDGKMNGKCNQAEWKPDSDDVMLTGNVVLTEHATGNELKAESVYMKPDGARMRCPGPATIIFYEKDDNDKKR